MWDAKRATSSTKCAPRAHQCTYHIPILHEWDYSSLASPLTTLTGKNVKFTWSEATSVAIRSLRQAFTTSRVLQHFQPDLPLTIEVDASDFALSCIISQTSAAGDLHPTCFYFRKFTPAELNYPIYDKNIFAAMEAFGQRRVYAEGVVIPIKVYTDHKDLKYFSHARTTSRRHPGWAATMAIYNYTITYCKGATNGKAGALCYAASREWRHSLCKSTKHTHGLEMENECYLIVVST